MEMIRNRYVVIKNHIDGAPQDSDFELQSSPLALKLDGGSNDIIVKNLYVSIDPSQINRMKTKSSSQSSLRVAEGITPGEAISAYGVARVVASGCPEFEKGDLVVGFISWSEYSVMRGDGICLLRKLDSLGFPLSYHVGVLGLSGLTAYGGFFQVCKPKRGEKVLVSAACGSVGNVVGQYAKLFGCYVVGSAGTKEKVTLLKEKLGFDDAFNYREETDLKSTLKRYFPEGIDIYFDNVGAEMLEAALANMNLFGRVAASGVISEYTDPAKRAAPDLIHIVYKRITVQGFLTPDLMNLHSHFISTTSDHLRASRIQALEDISTGIESIPSAFTGLFRGDNIGKKIVQLAHQ